MVSSEPDIPGAGIYKLPAQLCLVDSCRVQNGNRHSSVMYISGSQLNILGHPHIALIRILPFSLIKKNKHVSLFLTFFLPHCTACGILVYQPGIEPTTPALEAQSLNHWATREVSYVSLI